MKVLGGSTLLLALLFCGASPARPQAANDPEEQARRLLEDGRAYWREGKYKQALDNYSTIVSGFAATQSVDDALLEIGRHEADVEQNAEKARASFDAIAKRFPQSDSAPGAYYYLGLLALRNARGPADLEDALAQFTRVQRLYPKSEWVPRALHAAGLVQRRAGNLEEAVESQRRVSLEHPSSDAAAEAQFEIGHCLALLGEGARAMEEFQQVRNRFPEAPVAAQALDRVTMLWRLTQGGRPSFDLDTAFTVGGGEVLKDVRALLMTPARTLWIASDKTKSVVPFDAKGTMGPGFAVEDVRQLSLSPAGELVVASRLAARFGPRDLRSFALPGDKPGETQPLDRLSAVLALPGGDTLVADEKRKRVYRFGRNGEPKGSFPDAQQREVTRMALDSEGGIALLDADEKSVKVFDDSGKLLRAVLARGAGYELKKPADIAFDPARNLYLAEEDQGVLLFAPDAKLLSVLSGGDELRKLKALTLTPDGAVLVYSERAQRVLRFQ